MSILKNIKRPLGYCSLLLGFLFISGIVIWLTQMDKTATPDASTSPPLDTAELEIEAIDPTQFPDEVSTADTSAIAVAEIAPAADGPDQVLLLPARLEVLTQVDPGLSVLQRISALQALGVLAEEEMASIYQFLAWSENYTELSDGEWLWLKNDLMTHTRHHDPNRQRHLEQLAGLFRNVETDIVIRDYALQHLTALALGEEMPSAVAAVLEEAFAEKQDTLAGTALLGRMRIAEQQAEDPSAIAASALAIAVDASYDYRSRLTALQAGARYDSEAAAAIAAKLVSNESAHAMERISAIGVLAMNPQHLPLLQMQADDPDPRVRRAASIAIRNFTAQDR